MSDHDRYLSPLSTRNASPAMAAIWSPQRKFSTWRRLWLALAESQKELGLDITDEQLDQLRSHLDDIDWVTAGQYEKKLRHDVMAHLHTLGDAAPAARAIIHLGATSQFLNCNTDLLLIRDAMRLIAAQLACAVDALGRFAQQYRDMATLGFTHFQPAQPTTIGKRAVLWAYDLALALEEIEHRLASLKFRGIKGATGTQASFMALFNGDHTKVQKLDELVTAKMGWPIDKRFAATAQTYPRLVDGLVTSSLAAAAAAAKKFATDMRLLAGAKELQEPFEKDQVGSSVMAYKRNPMRCERICGLARFVIGFCAINFTTASEQWLERTLDDSSTRRLSLPEPFLALDGVLELVINVAGGIVVNDKIIEDNLAAQLPFMATENLMMAAVTQNGADRQTVHELIRKHSHAAAERIVTEATPNDLLGRLAGEPVFQGIDLQAVLNPAQFIGRAPQQVDHVIEQVITPIRKRYAHALGQCVQLHV